MFIGTRELPLEEPPEAPPKYRAGGAPEVPPRGLPQAQRDGLPLSGR